jgi:hypothetical protein
MAYYLTDLGNICIDYELITHYEFRMVSDLL